MSLTMSDSLRRISSPFSWSFGILIATVTPSFMRRACHTSPKLPLPSSASKRKRSPSSSPRSATEDDQGHDLCPPERETFVALVPQELAEDETIGADRPAGRITHLTIISGVARGTHGLARCA